MALLLRAASARLCLLSLGLLALAAFPPTASAQQPPGTSCVPATLGRMFNNLTAARR